MKNVSLKLCLGILSVLFLSACSEGGQLNLKNPISSILTKSSPGSEFVASSSQFQTSLTRNYKVQHATGSFASKLKQTSTPSGYKVYFSVQGSVISDELQ